MFEALGNAFLSARQKACETALLTLINRRMGRFGRVTELEIDSLQKKARIVLELKGESVPVEIRVESYQLQEIDTRWFLSVRQVQTSKEWLTALLEEFVMDRSFSVPEAARLAL